jgi:hypothetical protein
VKTVHELEAERDHQGDTQQPSVNSLPTLVVSVAIQIGGVADTADQEKDQDRRHADMRPLIEIWLNNGMRDTALRP